MLGTAASRPIRVESGPDSQRGASSERKTAVPSPIGTISTIATAVVSSVSTTRMPAPYWPAAGFQVPDQTKPMPLCWRAADESLPTPTSRPSTTAPNSPAPAQRSAE